MAMAIFWKERVYYDYGVFCDHLYGSHSPSIYNSNPLEPKKPSDFLAIVGQFQAQYFGKQNGDFF